MKIAYSVVQSFHELSHLRIEWTDLLRRSGLGSPFLAWEWMATWWEVYCEGRPGRRLAVATARRDGTLVALFPGYVKCAGLGRTTLAFLGTEFESTDYLQAISCPSDLPTVTGGLLDAVLAKEPTVDVVHLTNILSPDPMLGVLGSYAARRGARLEVEPFRVCPFVAVSGTWDAYLESLSAKMRKNVRRHTRQIFEEGAVFDWVQDRAQVPQAIHETFALHARRFEAKEAETGFKADLRAPFHVLAGERFLDRDMLRLFRLRVQGRTVASLYCLQSARTLYFFQAGIDPEWDRLSVGTVLIGLAIKYCFDHDLVLFDFMRGEEVYKFRWTSTTRPIVATRFALSATGRAGLSLRRHVLRAKALAKQIVRPSANQGASAPS